MQLADKQFSAVTQQYKFVHQDLACCKSAQKLQLRHGSILPPSNMNILGLIIIPDWILLTSIGIAIIYIFATWNNDFFKNQGLPTDPPTLFLGNILNRYGNKYMHEEDQKAYYKIGRIHGIFEGRSPVLMVGDPDMIKQILVKNFSNFVNRRAIRLDSKTKIVEKFLSLMQNEEWRATRHLLSPTFTSGKLKQMGPLMEECALEGINNTRDNLKKAYTKSLNVKTEFSMYAMNVIASCAFGLQTHCKSMEDPLYIHSRAVFDLDLSWKFALLIVAPWLARKLEIELFPHASLVYLKKITKEVMDKRKKDRIRRPDFLQLLLDAQMAEEKEQASNGNVSQSDSKRTVLDESCLVAQAILFLVAGFETVATTSSFFVYLLSLNPDCYEKLMDEIAETKEQNNGKLNAETIMQMPYLDMVLSETLRFYPFATRLERVCTNDVVINDIHIKKGMITAIPTYSMHHDEKYFPNPEKFDPERFSKENKDSINPYAYLPFGSGPRNCIGMRFAQMQIKIGLAYYLDKFKFSLAPETDIPLKFKRGAPQLTLINGVTLQLEEIK